MTAPSSGYPQAWIDQLRAEAIHCEALRHLCHKPDKTGTITELEALYLRSIVEKVKPKICAEIGTFIGTSALVLASTGAVVFTCDKDNDAMDGTLDSRWSINCFGKCSSTDMFNWICSWYQNEVDLFFFDGRIQKDDLPLIEELSHRKTVYAFHDYVGKAKGKVNVAALNSLAIVKDYRLILPPKHTSIAVMEPKR